jgi:hypothetical protein
LANFGVSLEDRCDFNGKVIPGSGPQFNQTQVFDTSPYNSQANGGAANLQYCNDANNCNSAPIGVTGLKNYFLISASSSLVPATFMTFVSLITVAVLMLIPSF